MSGCRCVEVSEGLIDMSDCPVHPVLCEAIHAETGLGCVHGPGHDGQHAASVTYMWGDPVDGR